MFLAPKMTGIVRSARKSRLSVNSCNQALLQSLMATGLDRLPANSQAKVVLQFLRCNAMSRENLDSKKYPHGSTS